MMTLQEAIARATKLLALSQSSEPHEAALAAQRAQEILTRYDIDKAALAADGGQDEPDEAIENFTDRAPLDNGGQRLAQWKLSLADRICDANACQAFQRGAAIGIIGRASDVEKVRYLYDMLVREVDRLTDRDGRGCGKSYRTEYRAGVVSAIGDKLRETHAKVASDMRANATGMALVRVDKALQRVEQKTADTAAWVRRNMRFRTKHTSVNYNASARQAGYAAGKTISIGNARGALGSGQRKLK